MTTIEKTFEIKAPSEKIWNIIADRKRIPELQPNVLEVEVNPVGLGSCRARISFCLQSMGKKSQGGRRAR